MTLSIASIESRSFSLALNDESRGSDFGFLVEVFDLNFLNVPVTSRLTPIDLRIELL